MSGFSRFISRIKNAVPNRTTDQVHFEELRDTVGSQTYEILSQIDVLNQKLDDMQAVVDNVHAITTKNFDHVFDLRRDLVEVRTTKEYMQLFEEENPLVTVRIATWNNSELLIGRAIKSVLAQTYDNWEIVVVGDGCDDDTESRIEALGDARITFYNFPYRNVYPDDARQRWQVAGSPGMNKGAELAPGLCIAPLDDDDEFTSDHIEVLLNKAREGQYEFVYGDVAFTMVEDGSTGTLSSYPPVKGGISTQAFMYPKILGFFEWETQSNVIDEPGDWNFVRRMMEAGGRMGKVDLEVANIYSMPPELK